MRVGVLFSGGKDSTATLFSCVQQKMDVACLLSMLPENPDSYMFQTPNEELLSAQVRSIGLPHLVHRTKGEKELELVDLRALLAKAKADYHIEGVGVGAVASDYQNDRVRDLCADLGLQVIAPFWHKPQDAHLRDILAAGFDVRMTRIAADGLDRSWLGRKLTLDDIDRLIALNKRLGINIAGEGGEFETIVLGGPLFAHPITIEFDLAMESACRGELRIKAVKSS